MYKLICCVAVAVVGLGGKAVAVIINVPGDQPTIQAGIDAAVDFDEVVVAVGTYNEAIDFLGKEITVRSTDPLDPAVVAATIIDPPAASTGVTITDALSNTVLSGFTVSGGDNAVSAIDGILGPVITNCVFSDNGISSGTSLVFSNCVFPRLTNCIISGNMGGGGLLSSSSSLIVRNCLFENNFNSQAGGGASLNGVGPLGNPIEVSDCTFIGNESASSGGGVWRNASGIAITRCTFTNNTTMGNGGGYFSNVPVELVECTFVGNTATGASSRGGGVSVPSGEIRDCTFRDNISTLTGGAIHSISGLNGVRLEFCDNMPQDIQTSGTNLDFVCNPCPPDLDGDGTVAVPDLLTLLAAWGSCP